MSDGRQLTMSRGSFDGLATVSPPNRSRPTSDNPKQVSPGSRLGPYEIISRESTRRAEKAGNLLGMESRSAVDL